MTGLEQFSLFEQMYVHMREKLTKDVPIAQIIDDTSESACDMRALYFQYILHLQSLNAARLDLQSAVTAKDSLGYAHLFQKHHIAAKIGEVQLIKAKIKSMTVPAIRQNC